jgi:hypothetical protein
VREGSVLRCSSSRPCVTRAAMTRLRCYCNAFSGLCGEAETFYERVAAVVLLTSLRGSSRATRPKDSISRSREARVSPKSKTELISSAYNYLKLKSTFYSVFLIMAQTEYR